MAKINQKKMDLLDRIGEKYDCKLLLPPFNGRVSPFYCVKNTREGQFEFQGLLNSIRDIGVQYRYIKADKVSYIEILG